MIMGYNAQVNNLIITTKDNKKLKRKLGVYGLNICGKNYTYYDTQMQLHILHMEEIKEIKMYSDKKLISTIN